MKRKGILTIISAICFLSLLAVTGAVAQPDPADLLIIDEGFRIFTEETFEGSGRTCASCHIPESGYSISPADIANLSKNQFESLLATSNKGGNTPVPGLENPLLLLHGLFNEGPGDAVEVVEFEDEFGEPVFGLDTRFQASPRVAAMALTTFRVTEKDRDQLGWNSHGGAIDPFPCEISPGVPADGNLISFAMGAVRQHFTKSLDRIPPDENNENGDFRCPTPEENIALEKFQLWLGRRPTSSGESEIDLGSLVFVDSRIEAGKVLFMAPETNCNRCHSNGGANVSFGADDNENFDTGVEDVEVAGIAFLESIAGVPVKKNPGDGNPKFAFNVPSLIEAPSSARGFHNNLVTTIEDDTRFYFTDAFLSSPAVRPSHCGFGDTAAASMACLGALNGGDFEGAINLIAGFLRALNAFYEFRNCEHLLNEAKDRIGFSISTDLPLQHCGFNLDDASASLKGAQLTPSLYSDVVERAEQLKKDLKKAQKTINVAKLDGFLDELAELKELIAAPIL